ncbi:30S ribosomal protein THX [Luteimonas salinilitoris]|uniref:30S ribosomal protein THX n=1 Tax=Luteimonas salinilitoris TaxID=3237697 RepID=A0ABV4HLA3_9GAMM
MGKGDRKTLKGKRYNSSYGKSRAHAVKKTATATQAPVTRKTVVKAPAKKAVAKKTVVKPE